jgi:hypothetical protein
MDTLTIDLAGKPNTAPKVAPKRAKPSTGGGAAGKVKRNNNVKVTPLGEESDDELPPFAIPHKPWRTKARLICTTLAADVMNKCLMMSTQAIPYEHKTEEETAAKRVHTLVAQVNALSDQTNRIYVERIGPLSNDLAEAKGSAGPPATYYYRTFSSHFWVYFVHDVLRPEFRTLCEDRSFNPLKAPRNLMRKGIMLHIDRIQTQLRDCKTFYLAQTQAVKRGMSDLVPWFDEIDVFFVTARKALKKILA